MINKFSCIAIALSLFACTPKEESKEKDEVKSNLTTIYIGTYTEGESEGIYKAQFNEENGALSDLDLVVKSENPSFLTLAGKKKLLVVNELDPGIVSVVDIEAKKTVQEISSSGIHPCHVHLNEEKGLVSVANYSSGNLLLLDWKNDSLIFSNFLQHSGSGPDQERQEGPHVHFSTASPNGQYVYANDLGIDKVMAYPITKPDSGFVAWEAQPGDGPRHLDFHPSKDFVFVLNELSNMVNSLKILENGTFEVIDRKSTLPDGFQDYSKAADIHVSADGKFLYVSNRGYDSIAIYTIAENGELSRVGFASEGIKNPRNFAIDNTGNWLLVANQDGNSIITFKIEKDGLLSPTEHSIRVGTPVCIAFERS